MPSIDWTRAGSANDETPTNVVSGFAGGYYCDSELTDAVTPETLQNWMQQHIAPLVHLTTWESAQPIQRPPILVNGLGSGPANVVAFAVCEDSDYDARVEYWTPTETANSDLSEDHLALLSVKPKNGDKEHILIVGCAVGHPYVCCDLFEFGNSDGSTNTVHMNTESAPALVQNIMAMAMMYSFQQVH